MPGRAYCHLAAMAESFFATLECELLARSRFKTQAEARNAVFEFIEGFYNPRRRHSSLGYLSPVEFERRHREYAASPGALHPAAVLGAVKVEPSRARQVRDLDRPSMEPMLVSESSRHRSRLNELVFQLTAAVTAFKASLPEGMVDALCDLVRSMNCYYSNLIEGAQYAPHRYRACACGRFQHRHAAAQPSARGQGAHRHATVDR